MLRLGSPRLGSPLASLQHGLQDLEQEPEQARDPWMPLHQESAGSDSWLLSYVDVLTLLLVLMVVLLMLQQAGKAEAEVTLESAALAVAQQLPPPASAQSPEARPPLLKPPFKPEARQEQPPLEASTGDIDPLLLAEDEVHADWPLLTESLPLADGAEPPLAGPALPEQGAEVSAETLESGDWSAERTPAPASRGMSTLSAVAPSAAPSASGQDPAAPLDRAPPETLAETLAEMQADNQTQAQAPAARFNMAPLVEMLRWKGLGDGVTLSSSETQVRLETRDNILFTDASAELTEAGASLLMELVALLSSYPGIISVEGHADSRPITSGLFPSNWELSSARATSVVRYLVEQGVDAQRLRAVGYGATRPRADNNSAEGRAANRRVSLVLELEPGATAAR
jgi:chemotaxis protein MotB